MYPEFSNLNNPPPGSVLSSNYLNPDFWFDKFVAFFQAIFHRGTVELINTICIFLALFFICVIFYCFVRLLEIRKKEHHHVEHEIAEYAHKQQERERKRVAEKATSAANPAWTQVLEHLVSGNAAQWKLAIIEADIMLDSLMSQMGFRGETLGEKLKSASEENFRNLSLAWEAHAVRNRIAHEPEYQISLHEAKRIIALYEQIFRTYGYI